MSSKAPSAGQKVTTGDRPVAREGPGAVPSESLAAESVRKGGTFASNPGMEQGQKQTQSQSQTQPRQSQKSAGESGTKSSGGGGGGGGGASTTANKATTASLDASQRMLNQPHHQPQLQPSSQSTQSPSGQGAAAPTYAAAQRHRNPAGPHGKNLTEGGFEGSGTAEGALPEPGSEMDPTRQATRDLRSGMKSAPGRRAGGGGGEKGVSEGTWYSSLGSDEPA